MTKKYTEEDVAAIDFNITGGNGVGTNYRGVTYGPGQEVILVVRAQVSEIAYPPYDKKRPGGQRIRRQKLKIEQVVDVTHSEEFEDIIAIAEEEARRQAEEANGIQSLFTDDVAAEHDDGMNTDIDLTTAVEVNGVLIDPTTDEGAAAIAAALFAGDPHDPAAVVGPDLLDADDPDDLEPDDGSDLEPAEPPMPSNVVNLPGFRSMTKVFDETLNETLNEAMELADETIHHTESAAE